MLVDTGATGDDVMRKSIADWLVANGQYDHHSSDFTSLAYVQGDFRGIDIGSVSVGGHVECVTFIAGVVPDGADMLLGLRHYWRRCLPSSLSMSVTSTLWIFLAEYRIATQHSGCLAFRP